MAIDVLNDRLTDYPTTLEVCDCDFKKHMETYKFQSDMTLLTTDDLTKRQRNAIIVRLGEKRILSTTLRELRESQEAIRSVSGRETNKRKAGHHRTDTHGTLGSQKKARR